MTAVEKREEEERKRKTDVTTCLHIKGPLERSLQL